MIVDLRDRVIVISGGSSGIGSATAVACADAGMDVVIAARREDKLRQVAQRIEETGRRCVPVACDVNRIQDVKHVIDQTIRELGRLDVVFANAGYGLNKSILDVSDREMRNIFETNFYGTLRLIHAALPEMIHPAQQQTSTKTPRRRKQYAGHVLITSSVVSEIGLPNYGAYCATKAAQDSIASSLRAELASDGVFVTSVHPSTTQTEFFDRAAQITGRPINPDLTRPNALSQTPERVAATIVRCLRKPRAEVWPMPGTRLAMAACTAMPQLTAWAMRTFVLKRISS